MSPSENLNHPGGHDRKPKPIETKLDTTASCPGASNDVKSEVLQEERRNENSANSRSFKGDSGMEEGSSGW